LQDNPKIIQPISAYNEIMGALKENLGDLCVTRSQSWGITLNEKQTI
jgi:methionyl-tRNA synthetase